MTFSLQDGDVQGVEEAQARLSFLAESNKLWSQQMFLDVGTEAIQLRDIQSQVRPADVMLDSKHSQVSL